MKQAESCEAEIKRKDLCTPALISSSKVPQPHKRVQEPESVQKKKPFGIFELREMSTHPLYAKKAAYFMRKAGLLEQFHGIVVVGADGEIVSILK